MGAPTGALVPEEAHLLALARLPRVGPARLRWLVDAHGGAAGAWQAVLTGRIDPADLRPVGKEVVTDTVADWRRVAATIEPHAVWQAHVDAGLGVAGRSSPAFPAPFVADDDPPGVICWQGDLDHLAGARAAVVGTRRATRYGLDVAHELGRGLADAGVAVVSGLALGIDGAAHAGALASGGAPPVAVVGSGLDRVYPRAHGPLWRQVARSGVVLSEWPLGVPPTAWRFPARNRLIAALADVVVVVESQATGGAMGTAVEAARRGVPVLAVPGPVTAASSDGTNQLLFEGCAPARDTADVLLAMGREVSRPRRASEARRPPTGDAADVLAQVPWGPVPAERLTTATGLDLGRLAIALDTLEADGWVARRDGWVERLGRPAGGR